jgi:hypothetical protein
VEFEDNKEVSRCSCGMEHLAAFIGVSSRLAVFVEATKNKLDRKFGSFIINLPCEARGWGPSRVAIAGPAPLVMTAVARLSKSAKDVHQVYQHSGMYHVASC